jgi:hypothetical protein
MNTELSVVTCAHVQFRVHRQVAELDSRHIALTVNGDLHYCNGLVATKK